jgi:hypothetical protein
MISDSRAGAGAGQRHAAFGFSVVALVFLNAKTM